MTSYIQCRHLAGLGATACILDYVSHISGRIYWRRYDLTLLSREIFNKTVHYSLYKFIFNAVTACGQSKGFFVGPNPVTTRFFLSSKIHIGSVFFTLKIKTQNLHVSFVQEIQLSSSDWRHSLCLRTVCWMIKRIEQYPLSWG